MDTQPSTPANPVQIVHVPVSANPAKETSLRGGIDGNALAVATGKPGKPPKKVG